MLQADVKRSLVTATAAGSLVACVLMGLGANMPVALAPGMGKQSQALQFCACSVAFWAWTSCLVYVNECDAVGTSAPT